MEKIILKNLKFEKYHGLGNDYIIINDIEEQIPEKKKADLAKKLCEFHFSVGADGLIYVCKSNKADIKYRIFNDDGSEAEMCGNGIRCFSKYVYENNIIKKKEIIVETLKGILVAQLNLSDGEVDSVKIDMGVPILECDKIPVVSIKNQKQCINEPIEILDKKFSFTAVSMGNPHAIIFIDDQINNDDLNKYGAEIESYQRFPKKTNVEFVYVITDTEAILRVYERAVGITHACGTGTCAAVVAGTILGKFKKNKPITVHNDGGDLKITYTGESVYMEGPVIKVFKGIIENLVV
jgi:diaminopimelate epimerase